MKEYTVYKNGEYITESALSISYNDVGFQRGYGVFDYIRTYNQKLFQADWHRRQLMLSLSIMNIPAPFSEAEYVLIMESLLDKNKAQMSADADYAIKTIITGGAENPLVLIYLDELNLNEYTEMRKTGAGLLVYHGQRTYPRAKCLDYRPQYVNQKLLREKRALEIMYVNNGLVFETATSNLFIVKNNEIITPAESIYKGSTREYVIDFAREYGYKVRKQEIPWQTFITADEVFITASKKEILPISHVHTENKDIFFSIGPVTKNLINIFQDKKQNL